MHFNERERKFIIEVENVVCMLRLSWKKGPPPEEEVGGKLQLAVCG